MPALSSADDRLGDDRPRAGPPHRERAGAEQHHRADDLALDRRTHPGRVRADKRLLELRPALGGDPDPGERAEPGGDAVHRLLHVVERGDDVGSALHGGGRFVGDADARVGAGDGDDLVGGQAVGSQGDFVGFGRRHRLPCDDNALHRWSAIDGTTL